MKCIKLELCNVETERVFKIKFVGVVIDHKLTLKGKILKCLAILY